MTATVPPVTSSTAALSWCGVAAGPLFVASVVIQEATRDGFDPRRHALSQLALGEHGWIQTATFALAGSLVLASALGLRRLLRDGPGRTWGPLLIGLYGIGLIWAAVFPTDPAAGFPPGVPTPAQPTLHGTLHNQSPTIIGLALIAACFVFARRFLRSGQRGWAVYSMAAPVIYLGLGFAAFPLADLRWLLLGGATIWLWAAATTYLLIRHPRTAGRP
ncbi:DUF998 domain-containing protein [Nonomuraea sp. LPB2021202275-12-8]|uniref:DUF998 domain-containing protein n=1 Tax=Nonomuraea sp. LPB2021202275-12-8 TaxID=3120159 RepID=UPI00300D9F54